MGKDLRGATGASAGRGHGGRFSVRRKRLAALRLLRSRGAGRGGVTEHTINPASENLEALQPVEDEHGTLSDWLVCEGVAGNAVRDLLGQEIDDALLELRDLESRDEQGAGRGLAVFIALGLGLEVAFAALLLRACL